jgi:two-component sensor histidine kinase
VDRSAVDRSAVSSEALSAICADVALRDLNLVDLLLSQLEEMEAREVDTERLAELFTLDHLAARLRRNAENLRVLAGRDASDTAAETTPLVDVIRAAMSSIDHYSRVTIGRVVPLGVVGFAAEDVSRLLAELLDNATKSSPPTTSVRVAVHLTEQGSALLRVEDEGIGLPPERLHLFNDRLRAAPVLDDDAVRHMGLAVVGRIADRHDMSTWLARRHPHGTTASVLLPAALLCELPESSWSGTHTVTATSTVATLDARDTRDTRDTGDASNGREAGGLSPVAATIAGLPSRRASRSSGRSRSASVGLAPRTAGGPARIAPTPPMLRPVPSPTSAAAQTGGTTSSGLPRRVSRSLMDATGPRPVSVPVDEHAAEDRPIDAPALPDRSITSHPAADHQAAGHSTADRTATDITAASITGADDAAVGDPAAERRTADDPTAERTANHARLLADLDAFSQGEQAARDEQRGA